jgi:hypothetical protein
MLLCPLVMAQNPMSPPQMPPPQMGPQKPWGIAALPSADSAQQGAGQPSGTPAVPSCPDLVAQIARLTFDLRLIHTPLTESALSRSLSAKDCDAYRAAAKVKWAASTLNVANLVSYCNEKIPLKARACFGQGSTGPLPKAQCDTLLSQAWDIMGTAHAMRLCRNLPVRTAIEAEACRQKNPSLTELFHRIDAAVAVQEKSVPPQVVAQACPSMIH